MKAKPEIPKTKAEFAEMLMRDFGHDEKLAKDCATIVAGYGAFNPILHDPKAMEAINTLIDLGYSSENVRAALEAIS